MATAVNTEIFISYNRADAKAAQQIRDTLKARGLTVFFDRDHLIIGQRWQEELEHRLGKCKAVVICLGPSGLGSWQQLEKAVALDRQVQDEKFLVIPVLLPGASDPGLGFLRLQTWIDLRQGADEVTGLEALVSAVRGEAIEEKGARPDPRTEICPFRGLRVFREEDAAFFRGREASSDQLLAKVTKFSLVAVIGSSGCGKSSVARAGLFPRLRAVRGDTAWELAVITPGKRPLHSLMAALSPPAEELSRAQRLKHIEDDVEILRQSNIGLGAFVEDILSKQPGTNRFLLLIDQFEELYSQTEQADDRHRLIELLTTIERGPLHVVLTLRGDYYGRALGERTFSDRLQDAIVNVGPMRPDELKRAIVEPAGNAGLTFEGDLVEYILEDVGTKPGNLPLLEFLLTELWQRRDRGNRLTIDAYRDTGGVKKSVAVRAQSVLNSLDSSHRMTARQVLVNLVTPGEGTDNTPVRIVIPKEEHAMAAREVINRFADARLLTTGRDETTGAETVEVSHEALIREWDTLRTWVDEDRHYLRKVKAIRSLMQAWAGAITDKDSYLLPQNRFLTEAKEILDREGALLDDIRPYIDHSIAVAQGKVANRLSPADVDDWITKRAYILSQNRTIDKLMSIVGNPSVFQYRSQNEMQEDWCRAEIYFAISVLDGDIDFINDINPASYYILERIWLSDVIEMKAYDIWRKRGSPISSSDETKEDYLTALDYFRDKIKHTPKRMPSEFETVSKYIADTYLWSGYVDESKERARDLIRCKAERLFKTTGHMDASRNWQQADDFVTLFYSNIIPAISLGNEENAKRLSEAIQIREITSNQASIVNVFEAVIMACFLRI